MSIGGVDPGIIVAAIPIGATAVVGMARAGRVYWRRRVSTREARTAAEVAKLAALHVAAANLPDALRAPDEFGRNLDIAVQKTDAAVNQIDFEDPLHPLAQMLSTAAHRPSYPEAERVEGALRVYVTPRKHRRPFRR